MAQKRINTINLLDPVGSPDDAWTAAYVWVFSIGRYLLIGVEVLVLGVFFTRFILDKMNNDLTDEINDKVAILSNEVFKDQDTTFKNLHGIFEDIDRLEAKQPLYSKEIAAITSGVPDSLTLDKFSFTPDRISLSILATQLIDVKDYEFSLKQNPKYSDVQVTISKSGLDSSEVAVGISFALTSELEKI